MAVKRNFTAWKRGVRAPKLRAGVALKWPAQLTAYSLLPVRTPVPAHLWGVQCGEESLGFLVR